MNLRISHQTEYRYAGPVHGNANELRLTPMRSLWQEVPYFFLRILPSTRVRKFTDFYGNTVSHFEVEEAHSRLVIEASSVVRTQDRYAGGDPFGVSLDALTEAASMEFVRLYVQPSPAVEITPELWRAAVDVREGCTDVFGLAGALMEYVWSSCRYVPGVTTVETTVSEFFQRREGVCQDFAHLMLAMCRSVHLPARYVSGYVYDARRKDIRGAHASHAWVEVWVPGMGWHGLDPTNNCKTREHYVVVALGRDYHDIAPVRGTFWGGAQREMVVSVHIEERP